MLTPQEKEYVLDKIREILQKIADLEIEVNNLGYYIADYEDEWTDGGLG